INPKQLSDAKTQLFPSISLLVRPGRERRLYCRIGLAVILVLFRHFCAPPFPLLPVFLRASSFHISFHLLLLIACRVRVHFKRTSNTITNLILTASDHLDILISSSLVRNSCLLYHHH